MGTSCAAQSESQLEGINGMNDATPAAERREPEPASIHPLFRSGSLTAISVLVGFP
jgi:hypothetical protein